MFLFCGITGVTDLSLPGLLGFGTSPSTDLDGLIPIVLKKSKILVLLN